MMHHEYVPRIVWTQLKRHTLTKLTHYSTEHSLLDDNIFYKISVTIFAESHVSQSLLNNLRSFRLQYRVANITDFSVEVRNLENDPYFSRFLYGVWKFTDFLRIWQFFDFFSTFFIVIGNHYRVHPWSSWTAYSDKKYMELNGAALNVSKSCVTAWKTAFPKDK